MKYFQPPSPDLYPDTRHAIVSAADEDLLRQCVEDHKPDLVLALMEFLYQKELQNDAVEDSTKEFLEVIGMKAQDMIAGVTRPTATLTHNPE